MGQRQEEVGQDPDRRQEREGRRDGRPETWAPFKQANGIYKKFHRDQPGGRTFDGVGFVFTAADPFAGIDLDGCPDPGTDELAPLAAAVVAAANT